MSGTGRKLATNYTTDKFQKEIDADDRFWREHFQHLAEAVETHNHTAGKGLGVAVVVGQDGTATITATNTFVAVTHGVGTTPLWIAVTAKELEGQDYYVDTVGATTFRINVTAAQTIDTNFYWQAGSDAGGNLATITVGNTSVTVAHGLGGVPASVIMTPKELEGQDCYVDTVGAVNFVINLTAAQTIDTNYYWRAQT